MGVPRKKKEEAAVDTANAYVKAEQIKKCNELVERIKSSKYARIDEAIKGLAAYQIEIIELIKKS